MRNFIVEIWNWVFAAFVILGTIWYWGAMRELNLAWAITGYVLLALLVFGAWGVVMNLGSKGKGK